MYNLRILKFQLYFEQSDEEIAQLKGEIDTDNEIPGPVVDERVLRQAPIPDEVRQIQKITCNSCEK